jgi:aspartate aminotransferase
MEIMRRELKVAQRMARLGTEGAFEVLNRALMLEEQGKEIIHLEIGEPDFETPSNITAAAITALNEGWTHYSPPAGIGQLREAIASYISQTRSVKVAADEVIVVPGGKPIIFFTLLALVESGDQVICSDPGFPIYESMVNFVGGSVVRIPLREERGFRLDVDELKSLICSRTKLIILNSPHNPTGGVLDEEDLRNISEVISDRDIFVLSDEIYSRLTFGAKHHSIISQGGMKDRTILLDGFSKAYAMTGWRLGYGVMRSDLAAHIARLMVNSNSCTSSFTQIAGIEALQGTQSSVDQMNAEFLRRRDMFLERIRRIRGFSCVTPKGAFYLFPNIRSTQTTSRALADALLEEAGVALLPGSAFGNGGEGYLRISIANSFENLEKAADRIEKWMQR